MSGSKRLAATPVPVATITPSGLKSWQCFLYLAAVATVSRLFFSFAAGGG
jgi:hypothetical protein